MAREFSLLTGWNSSYPETTGYIIPTVLALSRYYDDPSYRHRARRMLDWLCSIQFPEGGFQGGVVDAEPMVPVTFNTGQILMGLAAGLIEFGEDYLEPTRRAADWLCNTQDEDGCWRRYPTPFGRPGEKAYETHVAWGLLEAARALGEDRYIECAVRNVDWALSCQRSNGWFDKCCLDDPVRPLTHTLGYALRGVLEAFRSSREPRFLVAAERTANGLLKAMSDDGHLPGRLRSDWTGAVQWVCLTGSVQIAFCWLILFQESGDRRYYDAAISANRFVRDTILLDGPEDQVGAVSGCYPVNGGYGTYEYLNWAAKFFIDSHLLQLEIDAS